MYDIDTNTKFCWNKAPAITLYHCNDISWKINFTGLLLFEYDTMKVAILDTMKDEMFNEQEME